MIADCRVVNDEVREWYTWTQMEYVSAGGPGAPSTAFARARSSRATPEYITVFMLACNSHRSANGAGVQVGACHSATGLVRYRLRGFTLVELLLVLAIISVVTAITLPNLVKSMRGNRLRTASRAIITAGRYARSIAVLKQEELLLTFDLDGGRIQVSQAASRSSDAEGLSVDDENGPKAASAPPGTNDGRGDSWSMPASGSEPAPVDTGYEDLSRHLDRVTIDYVEVEKGDKQTKGKCSIRYRSNGTCMPYAVRIVDQYKAAITIEVDGLSSARTENE